MLHVLWGDCYDVSYIAKTFSSVVFGTIMIMCDTIFLQELFNKLTSNNFLVSWEYSNVIVYSYLYALNMSCVSAIALKEIMVQLHFAVRTNQKFYARSK